MLRGINRQVIFEHPVDYRKFIDLLCLMVSPSDELGRSLPSLCRIYAYCLMPNHVQANSHSYYDYAGFFKVFIF